MRTRRLAIVEDRDGRWVPVQLVGGDIADTLLEMLTPDECVKPDCTLAGSIHGHDDSGTWIKRQSTGDAR